MRRVPSLRGLQAFEAVARSGNLAAAADSIGITPSAMSHRLRGLESELGLRLLVRSPKGLALTEAGRRFRPPVEEAFSLLAQATADLKGPGAARPLTVSLTSSIGVQWLMPRFHRFRAQHPDIEIAILTTGRPVDLLAGEADLALRYGEGPWPGLRVEPVLRFVVSPVCAPRLLETIAGLSPAEALSRSTFIDSGGDDWEAWLEAAGLCGIKPARRSRFGDFPMALAAAIHGEGFVLGYSGYVEQEIAAGALVQPFDLKVPVRKGYYLVYPEARLADPRVRAFRDWVVSETEFATARS